MKVVQPWRYLSSQNYSSSLDFAIWNAIKLDALRCSNGSPLIGSKSERHVNPLIARRCQLFDPISVLAVHDWLYDAIRILGSPVSSESVNS